jgi:beta-aspartyl-dipeptidase (metallo-type)
MLALIKGVEIYCPKYQGRGDILCCFGRILKIASEIKPPPGLEPLEIFDCTGKIATPGFLDYHNHFAGGGGSSGFISRAPEIYLSQLTTAGITTVVGCLGMDGTTKSMAGLLGKAYSLEAEGITTFLYSGATLEHPVLTLTGRLRTDMIYTQKVIGAGEVSLSELGPTYPSFGSGAQYIAKIASEVIIASRISGKAGLICLQVPSKGGLEPLFAILERTKLPIHHFIPAHLNQEQNYFEQGIRFGQMGGFTDVTSAYSPIEGFKKAIKPSTAVTYLLKEGVLLEQITMSTDGGGAHPSGSLHGRPAGSHYLSVMTLLTEFKDLVQQEGMDLADALKIVTSNVAKAMYMHERKGNLIVGADADILIFSDNLDLEKVFAKGRLLVDEGKPTAKGMWEDL